MTKNRVCGVAALVALALIGPHALAAENSIERELQDRAQIEKLMWTYVRALDTEDADAYAAVYMPDGQFGTGANAVKGREALKKMINDLRQRAVENEAKSGEEGGHVPRDSEQLPCVYRQGPRATGGVLDDRVRCRRAEDATPRGGCRKGDRRTGAHKRAVAN
jgi:SnoaL-like domain